MGLHEDIDVALEDLWGSDYVQKNPTKAYKTQYNAEYLEVAEYLAGGSEPNITNYSRMGKSLVLQERSRRATAAAPPPPPPLPPPVLQGVSQPSTGKKWGGNEAQAMLTHDFVIASMSVNGNPNQARANGNPGLTAICGAGLDPYNSDWNRRKPVAFTYGSGLLSFGGINDTFQPLPVGQIRGFQDSDRGCMQTDKPIQGFAIHKPDTAAYIRDVIWYAWKLAKCAELGYTGMWSDNLVPGNVKGAGWFYGSSHESCSGTPTQWDAGISTISMGLRSRGIPLVGGNVAYRAISDVARAATNVSELETLQDTIAGGATAFDKEAAALGAWDGANTLNYLLIVHIVAQADAAMQKFGLACSCLLNGCYFPIPYQDAHQFSYQPAEIKKNGQRNYLGRPTSPIIASGNIRTRHFERGRVDIDWSNRTATFS